ncbi:MAG: hypothetical protein ABSD08_08200 [Xanthobacteraceae bacterium]|jgi:hypothetical protein
MPLNLSQFKLQRAVLEIRYAQSFLVWDHAGVVWQQLRTPFPEIKLRTAQPNQQTLSLSKKLTAQVALESSNLTAYSPISDAEPFAEACMSFFPLVLKQLEISNLTRIGYRSFFQKSFETKQAASEFGFEQLPYLRRKGKHFNIDGESRDPELALRWEGDATGILVRLQTIQQKLEADVPADFESVESINVERYVVVLDLDYYAHGNTSAAKFQPRALIESWSRLIRRDVEGFFNG